MRKQAFATKLFTMAAGAVAFCAIQAVLAGPVQAGCCTCTDPPSCKESEGACTGNPNCNGTNGGSGWYTVGACDKDSNTCIHEGGGPGPGGAVNVGAPLMSAPLLGALVVGLGSVAVGSLRRKR